MIVSAKNITANKNLKPRDIPQPALFFLRRTCCKFFIMFDRLHHLAAAPHPHDGHLPHHRL